jgi:hypothetical protein
MSGSIAQREHGICCLEHFPRLEAAGPAKRQFRHPHLKRKHRAGQRN